MRRAISIVTMCALWMALAATPAFAEFGIRSFDGQTINRDGSGATQAGARPYQASTSFSFDTIVGGPFGGEIPDGDAKDVIVELPPGLAGNPTAAPTCTGEEFSIDQCPHDSQVGVVDVKTSPFGGFTQAVYNLVPPDGVLARFGFNILSVQHFKVDASLRSEDGYAITVASANTSQALPLYDVDFAFWGVPADPSHDFQRCRSLAAPVGNDPAACVSEPGRPASAPRRPFLSLPMRCEAGPLTTTLRVDPWQTPGAFESASFISHLPDGTPTGVTGCDRLPFAPSMSLSTTARQADSPSGLEVVLRLPQSDNPDGLASAHLRRAVVRLPEGVAVNPSSASGLDACSMWEVGISAQGVPNEKPVSCPASARIATLTATTPALEGELSGDVYLARQYDNPFGSLIAIYLVARSPERGILVKLAGKIEADPATGRLTAIFDDNPQLPVEQLEIEFKSGPRAPLTTPRACGTYTTEIELTSWSGHRVEKTSSFEVDSGPAGASCPRPGQFEPRFEAGTATPLAGHYSPLLARVSRPDGSDALKGLVMELPEGLTGRLAGTPYCPEAALGAAAANGGRAELASPSCPIGSQVGTVDVAAGSGSFPFHVSGSVYLTGPYRGAPLSLAVVTPAVAGPFDLGTVVIRTALEVDRVTTRVRAVSDQLPHILQGIPLAVRSVAIQADKPRFTLNPTGCDPMDIGGSLFSFATRKLLSSRFQVGGCAALPFKPKLAIRLSGKTNRSAHPKLRATLTMPPGSANIARAQVTMPKTQLLAQEHIRTICTRVQYAAKSCPKAAVYGYAKAWSPLLDQPLRGPVYLRSSSNPLPDLVADLNGQIEVDVVGRIDAVNARIRTTFETVPDAPVSKFVLTMQGGKKGLLVNNTELCNAKPRASASYEAHSGKRYEAKPMVKADCGKGQKGQKGKKRSGK